MADKADWANFSEDEDEDQNEPQEQVPEGKTQEYYREAYAEDLKGYQEEEEARPSNYIPRGRGGRGGGGRGERGRGRGRGGRGGGRGEGQRDRERDRDNQKPKQLKENQPKAEMINLIKRARDDTTFINLFDVDFKATPDDIRKLYDDVKIDDVNMIKPGLFLVELQRDEAIKMVEIGPKSFNQREFFMKLGYSNKRQHPEESYHNVNVEKHRYDVGHREDRPRRGGKQQHYNRREQFEEPSPRYQKDNRNKGLAFNNRINSEPAQIETNNKFFAGHDLKASEFKLRFTNSSKRESEANEVTEPPTLKASKSNPFGEAVARDEQDYTRKKEEEKKQVQEPQKPFEEKKEEPVQQQAQPKEQKLAMTTPVNSIDSQNAEAVEEAARKTGPRFQFEDKGRYNQGGYEKNFKKSGFGGKGSQVVYEAKGRGPSDYQEDYRPKNKYQDDNRQNKGYSNNNNNKYNKFDALK